MKLSDIHTIANIGAGTMGHATALQFAMNGYTVNVLTTTQKSLDAGLENINSYINVSENKLKILLAKRKKLGYYYIDKQQEKFSRLIYNKGGIKKKWQIN